MMIMQPSDTHALRRLPRLTPFTGLYNVLVGARAPLPPPPSGYASAIVLDRTVPGAVPSPPPPQHKKKKRRRKPRKKASAAPADDSAIATENTADKESTAVTSPLEALDALFASYEQLGVVLRLFSSDAEQAQAVATPLVNAIESKLSNGASVDALFKTATDAVLATPFVAVQMKAIYQLHVMRTTVDRMSAAAFRPALRATRFDHARCFLLLHLQQLRGSGSLLCITEESRLVDDSFPVKFVASRTSSDNVAVLDASGMHVRFMSIDDRMRCLCPDAATPCPAAHMHAQHAAAHGFRALVDSLAGCDGPIDVNVIGVLHE